MSAGPKIDEAKPEEIEPERVEYVPSVVPLKPEFETPPPPSGRTDHLLPRKKKGRPMIRKTTHEEAFENPIQPETPETKAALEKTGKHDLAVSVLVDTTGKEDETKLVTTNPRRPRK